MKCFSFLRVATVMASLHSNWSLRQMHLCESKGRAEGMTRWCGHLLCKWEDLNLNSQPACERVDMAAHAFGRDRSGEGNHCLTSQDKMDSDHVSRQQGRGNREEQKPTLLENMCTHTHLYTHESQPHTTPYTHTTYSHKEIITEKRKSDSSFFFTFRTTL